MSKWDYDLFVIGAGSGGVRASRMSARYGAKVAVVEGRYLGGTCVNVGCVPKKLFVYGSHFAEDFEDAAAYGWNVGAESLRLADVARQQDARDRAPERQSIAACSRARASRSSTASRSCAIVIPIEIDNGPPVTARAYSDRHGRLAARAGISRVGNTSSPRTKRFISMSFPNAWSSSAAGTSRWSLPASSRDSARRRRCCTEAHCSCADSTTACASFVADQLREKHIDLKFDAMVERVELTRSGARRVVLAERTNARYRPRAVRNRSVSDRARHRLGGGRRCVDVARRRSPWTIDIAPARTTSMRSAT